MSLLKYQKASMKPRPKTPLKNTKPPNLHFQSTLTRLRLSSFSRCSKNQSSLSTRNKTSKEQRKKIEKIASNYKKRHQEKKRQECNRGQKMINRNRSKRRVKRSRLKSLLVKLKMELRRIRRKMKANKRRRAKVSRAVGKRTKRALKTS